MLKRYRYRAYPTVAQQQMLARTFGCARVVFNDAIAAREAARKTGAPYLKVGELSRRLITEAKRTPERVWLSEVSAVVLQQALADADRAYRNFFDSLSGRRKGRRVPQLQRAVGVDVGLNDLAAVVATDGTREKIPNPRFLRRKERALARAQRCLSRKRKGSNNREKARRRVAVLHRKVRETRLDHAHKLARRLTVENQAVAVEDLCVSGLTRTRMASRSTMRGGHS